MTYDRHMDPECIELCDALNDIDDVKTVESCCGHGRHGFWILFKADSFKPLYFIGKAIDRRYAGGTINWKCKIDISDLSGYPVLFLLTSGKTKGEKAYKEASKIAGNIRRLRGLR